MLNLPEKDEIDVDKQYKSDIDQLKRQIQTTKDKIFRFYTLKRKSQTLLNDENLPSTPLNFNLQLKESFYNKIAQLKCKDDDSLTVMFESNDKLGFGFNLVKTNHGKWSLEKCNLPTTIDTDHFKKEISQLNLKQIPEYVDQIHRNVIAYNTRQNLVNQLKEIMDPRIRLYHCLRYIELELTFKVFNKETKIRTSLTIQLNFDLLSVKAVGVACKINGNKEDEEMRDFFKEHFTIFTKMDMISAYQEAFKNVDIYNFFV